MTAGFSYNCKECQTRLNKERIAKIYFEINKNKLQIGPDEKLCKQCGEVKHKDCFNKNKARRNGVYSMCSDCRKKSEVYPKSSEQSIVYKEEFLREERWATISFNNIEWPYKISDCGRVLIIKRNTIAKPSFDQRGYPQIVLSKNMERIGRRIHILVAEYFVYGKEEGLQVNHKDGNKLNPHYKNLEWCLPKENMAHSVKNNLWKPFNSENHPQSIKVINTNTGKVYSSITEVEKISGIKRLGRMLQGITKNNTEYRYYE